MYRERYQSLSIDPHMIFTEVVIAKVREFAAKAANENDSYRAEEWNICGDLMEGKKGDLRNFFKDNAWTTADMTTSLWFHNQCYGGEWYSPVTEKNLNNVRNVSETA